MMNLLGLASFFSAVVAALATKPTSQCEPAFLNVSTNVWKSYKLHPNPHYQKLVLDGAAGIQDDVLKNKALKIADVGTFIWVKNASTLSVVEEAAKNAPCEHIVGVVLHGTHKNDCSSRRFQPMDLQTYQQNYIDPLANILKSNPGTAFAIIIEPDTLATIVVNSDIQQCGSSATSFSTNVAYALNALSLPNAVLYLDAGHGGWLGWDANLKPGANYFTSIYNNAGSPSQLRGFAVNTGGWNSWDAQPGEFETTRETPRNRAQNEKTFVRLFGELLGQAGVPNHAIMDTSRNGVLGVRADWTEWCNVDGAGFGRLPTSEGTGLELADAFVWVKGGGVSDGTSDSSSVNYGSFCGRETAFKPSPEEGEWNQAYFEMLLENAKPSITT
ncbi:hypothetical protein OQA88_2334 [Cercophora sp. LCS_1]